MLRIFGIQSKSELFKYQVITWILLLTLSYFVTFISLRILLHINEIKTIDTLREISKELDVSQLRKIYNWSMKLQTYQELEDLLEYEPYQDMNKKLDKYRRKYNYKYLYTFKLINVHGSYLFSDGLIYIVDGMDVNDKRNFLPPGAYDTLPLTQSEVELLKQNGYYIQGFYIDPKWGILQTYYVMLDDDIVLQQDISLRDIILKSLIISIIISCVFMVIFVFIVL